jgi:hypothetical protein
VHICTGPVAVRGAEPGDVLGFESLACARGRVQIRSTCPLIGTFQLILHQQDTSPVTALADLKSPCLETADEWVFHGFSYANHLAELGPDAQSQIYEKSSVDLAKRGAFRKMRHSLMTTRG